MNPKNVATLTLSAVAGTILLLGSVACGLGGSSYPNKDITYIVAWGQGGAADGVARTLAETTAPHLGVSIVVKNVTGGSGTIGATELANSKPDGYTVAQQMSGPLCIQPHVMDIPYKWPDDFQVLSMVFQQPYIWVVKSDSPYEGMKDIEADAKNRKTPITFAASGVGTGQHLAMEYVSRQIGLETKIVPFKTSAEGVTALLGGHVDSAVAHPPDIATHVREGRLKPIASFSEFPGMETIPGLTSLKSQGYDLEAATWSCNVVPSGTPEEVVEKLRAAFKKGMEDPTFVDHMKKTMMPIVDMPAEEVVEKFNRDSQNMAKLVKELNLKK